MNENATADVNATKDLICQKITSQGMDGATVISASIVGSNNGTSPISSYTSPDSTSNLPLILGVAVGGGVLGMFVAI